MGPGFCLWKTLITSVAPESTEKGGEDYPDNHLRFSFLAAAAVQVLPEIVPGPARCCCTCTTGTRPWRSCTSGPWARVIRSADRVATVLSVHNGGFQGHFPPDSLPEMGLPWELYHVDFMEWYGRANILKAGLVFTDMATTVSPSHSFELRTEAGGFGLHHTFLGLHDRLVGVLNGIDFRIWDPETDPYIPANYSAAGSFRKG